MGTRVRIINRETEVVIFEYPITVEWAEQHARRSDLEKEAWENAVEDQLVIESDRGKYRFEILT